MHTKDVENYLKEISRVLKKGGKCLITFFLINEDSKKLIQSGYSTQNLFYKIDEYSIAKDINVPENAIGFNEQYIKNLFESCDMKIGKEIYYGSWCGRKDFVSYQDIIIAEKL